MKGYWILFHCEYCPLCGRSDDWQERIFDRPKPKHWTERHLYTEVYDYCDAIG